MDIEEKIEEMAYSMYESGSQYDKIEAYVEAINLLKELQKSNDIKGVKIVNNLSPESLKYFECSLVPILALDEVMIFEEGDSDDLSGEFSEFTSLLYKHGLCKHVEYC